MRVRQWEFTPPAWVVPVFLALFVLLLGLSVWQIRRGQAKAQIIAQRVAAGKTAPVPLDSVTSHDYPRVVIKGHYLQDKQLLLDNQIYKHNAGFHVWTPLLRDDGKGIVMVDRGWIPMTDQRRGQPSAPAASKAQVRIVGLWRDWPSPGLRVANHTCNESHWPRIMEYPTYPEVACNYNRHVADGLLLLGEDQPGGFPRTWERLEGLPPSRHYGYALQWFALAMTLLVIFIALNTRRITDE